jgi:hypothetical protein
MFRYPRKLVAHHDQPAGDILIAENISLVRAFSSNDLLVERHGCVRTANLGSRSRGNALDGAMREARGTARRCRGRHSFAAASTSRMATVS